MLHVRVYRPYINQEVMLLGKLIQPVNTVDVQPQSVPLLLWYYIMTQISKSDAFPCPKTKSAPPYKLEGATLKGERGGPNACAMHKKPVQESSKKHNRTPYSRLYLARIP